MPRRQRTDSAGFAYHVLNRAVARATLFESKWDYFAFIRLIGETKSRIPIRVLAFCVMPNHWHLLLWPREDGELSEFMWLLTVTHVQRWHAVHGTSGSGALYQGRFKSFPIEADDHLLTVHRYIERNPVRAGLAKRSTDWPHSSCLLRRRGDPRGLLDEGPVPLSPSWEALVDQPIAEPELERIRKSAHRGTPFGSRVWVEKTAGRLGLQSTLRLRGRPRSD